MSHGPSCLDGVTAAVVVARFHAGADVRTRFANNPEINEVLQSVAAPSPGTTQDLWITDIGWTRPETDRHLTALTAAGTRIFWIDHHRTAIERVRRGVVDVPLADRLVEDTFAASRLTFDYLRARLAHSGADGPPARADAAAGFLALERLVMLADDNDRWVHALDGSHDLALTVAAMREGEAYADLLGIDAAVTYTPRMRAAFERVAAELAESRALADRTRVERPANGVRVVAAWCAGYPSEIGDAWGRQSPGTVFALYDTKSQGVSFRRAPDCPVDLSKVAEQFGGGGHAAAAGCQIAGIEERGATALAELVGEAVRRVIHA